MNGINGTWKLVRKLYSPIEFKIGNHRFAFYRLHVDDYGFMNMADYPTDKATDHFTLAEARGNSWVTASTSFHKNIANKIYYNVTNKEFTFIEFLDALTKEGIEYVK